eukprot:scpid80299/ scgid19580/ 
MRSLSPSSTSFATNSLLFLAQHTTPADMATEPTPDMAESASSRPHAVNRGLVRSDQRTSTTSKTTTVRLVQTLASKIVVDLEWQRRKRLQRTKNNPINCVVSLYCVL